MMTRLFLQGRLVDGCQNIGCVSREGSKPLTIQVDSLPDPKDFRAVSNRELAIDLIRKLPADTPLEEIAREIELLAGISIARAQARKGEGIPAEDARKLVDSWASQ